MALRLTTPAPNVDLSKVEANVQAAHDLAEHATERAENARSMVLNRDPRLRTLEEQQAALEELAATLATAIPNAEATHAQLQAGIDAALARAMTPGPAGDRGPVGPSGMANLAVGARPVTALVLGATATATVPLSRTLPDTTYRVEMAHSAIVTLAAGMLTEVSRTTSSVTVRVTAVGVAIAGGTLVVVVC